MSGEITTAMISSLRDVTGAGILDCKKALTAANGNIENAIKSLREKGLANAAKKSGNVAADGVIFVKVSDDFKKAWCIEVNCQTDFVAKGEIFAKIVNEIYQTSKSVSSVESALSLKTSSGQSLEEFIKASIAQTGENITLRRIKHLEISNGVISSYIHNTIHPQMGKIGVLLSIESSFNDKQKLNEFGKKICMHIASTSPISLDEKGVPQDAIQNEKDIFTAQAQQTGKPSNVIEKMVEGRIKKFLAETVLLNQQFVMDNKITIQDFVNQFSKEISTPVSLKSFVLFKLGEGIEKKEENFAEEVASMTKK